MKPVAHNLTDGSISKSIIAFSVPILFSYLLQQLYNSVDSAILGWFVGPDALASAGSVGSLFNLLVGFSLGLATGINILFAIQYGAGNHRALRQLIGNGLLLSILAAAVISSVGIGLSSRLLTLIRTPASLMAPSRSYLTVLSAGAAATMLYNVGAGMLRAEGDSVRPLIYLAVGGFANLVLDLLFVVWFRMGITGAAWATVLAQCITAVLVLLRLTRMNPAYALRWGSLRFHRETALKILQISLPCGLQSSMFNISNLLIQVKINSFGPVIMAGYTAYSKVDSFVYMPIFAFSATVSTFVGQNKGAGRGDRISRGILTGLSLTGLVTALLSAVVLGFTEPLLRLFTDDPEAVDLGIRMSRYLMPFVAIYSVSDILGSAIRGFGQSGPVTAISVIWICLFRVLWLEVMFSFFHDVRIVFLCYPISWMLCVATVTWYYFRRSEVYRYIQSS